MTTHLYLQKRGFTLLELLVVIAIIGTLASIILLVLYQSKDKGSDGAIQGSLQQFRPRVELVYTSVFANSYGTLAYTADCASVDADPTPPLNNVFEDANANQIYKKAILLGGGAAKCASGPTWYIIAIPLKTDPTSAWCIDSSTSAKIITFANFVSGEQNCVEAGNP